MNLGVEAAVGTPERVSDLPSRPLRPTEVTAYLYGPDCDLNPDDTYCLLTEGLLNGGVEAAKTVVEGDDEIVEALLTTHGSGRTLFEYIPTETGGYWRRFPALDSDHPSVMLVALKAKDAIDIAQILKWIDEGGSDR